LEQTTSASFIGPIINDGTIILDPNIFLDVTGTITGIGKFWIDSGSTLEFTPGSKVAPGTTDSQIIYFEQGAGKLIIDDWGKFDGVITGTDIGTHLTPTDLIDLTQLPFVGGEHVRFCHVQFRHKHQHAHLQRWDQCEQCDTAFFRKLHWHRLVLHQYQRRSRHRNPRSSGG
jgi:hypothetical protein